MRALTSIVLACLSCQLTFAQDALNEARRMELAGESLAARQLLQKQAASAPNDPAKLGAYARFLDIHHDPAARGAYEQLLALLDKSGEKTQQMAVARRLALLDLIAGDRAAAERHLSAYQAAGGQGLTLGPAHTVVATQKTTIQIPGPLRSFSRMAALSPELPPEEFLAAFARNIVTNGYQAGSANEGLDQTEYLKLVVRYLSQARELDKFAGASKMIQIESCDTPQTGDLLKLLGYRMRGGCGAELVLETVNATRAFLTIDSGFPLSELEKSLRNNQPFRYDYHPSIVPILYDTTYWMSTREKDAGEFIDNFLADPQLARLYLALAKLDPETAETMRKNIAATKLKGFAHVLDFYGSMFQIRDGKAVLPGGAKANKAWADMVGVNPDQGSAFFERLVARDDGWLASYYDSVARLSGSVQAYLVDGARMKRYYAAIRGKISSPGPARPVFRANTDMVLLTSRMRLDPDGRPHIPGSLEIWRNLFVNHPHGKYDAKLSKAASNWKDPDDVIEALFALCRKSVENEPLKIYIAMSDLDRRRAKPLEAATVDRLAREYHDYGAQYAVLAEVPNLQDKTIIQFLDVAKGTLQSRDQQFRADEAGILQGLLGIWQILARQESIPPAKADQTLSAILTNFTKVKTNADLFDSGRESVKILLAATNTPPNVSVQDRMIDLLAGASEFADEDTHSQLIRDMIRTFEAQRLVSLTSMFELADHLEQVAKGGKLDMKQVGKTVARITEIQLPRASLSSNEKNAMAFGYWTDKHIEHQRKLNLRALVDKAGADAEKARQVRGELAPVLRDTLVGLNYVHYAPPGAQVLQTNPLFVRSHDFLGPQGTVQTWRLTEVYGSGWPSSAGGRLVGSLCNLPYALAEAEQNFLIPSREQALIWGDLVPQMIVSAKVSRYWKVTPSQLHWVGAHMVYGEALVAQAALDPARRQQILESYDRVAAPARVQRVRTLLTEGDVKDALDQITPSELFMLATDSATKGDENSPLATELKEIAAADPAHVNYPAISRAFGSPKPTLTTSYSPELLNMRTYPTLMGYSSRLMAESWESSNLYYAALADEIHLQPSQLNVVIPEWTQQTVERIFATHLEDWPALLRSLRLVGDDTRSKNRKQWESQKASLQ